MRRLRAWVGVVCALVLAATVQAQTPGGNYPRWPGSTGPARSPAGGSARPAKSARQDAANQPSIWDRMKGFVGAMFHTKPKRQPTPITAPNTSLFKDR
jgi:hypothetical protein